MNLTINVIVGVIFQYVFIPIMCSRILFSDNSFTLILILNLLVASKPNNMKGKNDYLQTASSIPPE